ncbi:MAG: hypothetical protein ACOCWB_07430 [Bacteroidota bacterium]
MNIRVYLSFFLCCVCALGSYAQTETDTIPKKLQKNIRVYSEPKVQLSDVVRISDRPQSKDSISLPVDVRYSINTKPVATLYEISTLRAVSITGDKLPELYRGIASVGFGNYAKSYASFRYMSERSRQNQYGFNAYHYASAGKVRLDNDQKVAAGYSTDYLSAYGKVFKDKVTLYGSLTSKHETVRLYGYETDTILPIALIYDTTLAKENTQRRVFSVSTQGGIMSRKADDDRYQFTQEILHDYTRFSPGLSESLLQASSEGFYTFDLVTAGYNADLSWSARNFDARDSLVPRSYIHLNVLPYIGAIVDNWHLRVGLNMSQLWGDQQFRAYPDVKFDYICNDYVFVPYIRYNGRLESYSMKDMYEENPYFSDSLMLKPTHYASVFDVGIRGRALKNLPFKMYARFANVENMHFWVNDVEATDTAQNTFKAVYDDASIFTAYAEGGVSRKKFDMLWSVTYNSYDLKNELRAWHRPGLEAKYTMKYNIVHPKTQKNKLVLKTDIFFEDIRYAQNRITGKEMLMNGLFDCNIGIEYFYSSVFVAFLDFQNLTATKYERFNKYPVQRFQVMFGVSYSFSGLRK